MNEGLFMMFMLMAVGGGGISGYFWGKSRATRQFLERFGDMLLREEGRRSAGATPPDAARVSATIDRIAQRFDEVEERLDFTERLVQSTQNTRRHKEALRLTRDADNE
jgi:hypothetical protein